MPHRLKIGKTESCQPPGAWNLVWSLAEATVAHPCYRSCWVSTLHLVASNLTRIHRGVPQLGRCNLQEACFEAAHCLGVPTSKGFVQDSQDSQHSEDSQDSAVQRQRVSCLLALSCPCSSVIVVSPLEEARELDLPAVSVQWQMKRCDDRWKKQRSPFEPCRSQSLAVSNHLKLSPGLKWTHAM